MRILKLESSKKPNGIEFRGLMGGAEFKQLGGDLHNLCVFSTARIAEPATYTKTGARHSAAKYLLFPAALRRQSGADEFDFDRMTCATMQYRQRLYVIYSVPSNELVSPTKTDE